MRSLGRLGRSRAARTAMRSVGRAAKSRTGRSVGRAAARRMARSGGRSAMRFAGSRGGRRRGRNFGRVGLLASLGALILGGIIGGRRYMERQNHRIGSQDVSRSQQGRHNVPTADY